MKSQTAAAIPIRNLDTPPLVPRSEPSLSRDHWALDHPANIEHREGAVPAVALRGAVVLETDVNGLGAIRSLAALRPIAPAILGVDFTSSIGFRSRLCRVHSAPAPQIEDGRALCDFLCELADSFGGPLALFPSGDRTVRLICRHREALSIHYRFLLVDHERIESLLNKAAFAELARRVGAAVPIHAVVEARAGAAKAAGLRFPIVAKPLNAPGDDPIRRLFKARCFESATAWDDFFSAWRDGGQVLIQEMIPGADGSIYFYGGVWSAGRPVCGFTGRKIRQQPRGFGSTVMAACERHDDVKSLAERFLREIEFTGLCDVEFKRDDRNGQLFLIEVNPRQGQWHRIGRACGIDLMQAAYLTLCGIKRDWPGQPAGCSGFWSYQFQDMRRLVDDWRRGERKISRWLRPYFSAPSDGVFDWRDLGPWFSEFAGVIRRKVLGSQDPLDKGLPMTRSVSVASRQNQPD